MTDTDFKPDLTERLAPGVRVVKKPHRVRRIFVLVMLIGFLALVIYAFNQSSQTAGEGSVPIIKADTNPIKVRPDDAGGVEIPHQDKLVYEQIAGKGVESMPERLMPEPEEPVQQTLTPTPTIDTPPVAQTDAVTPLPEPVAVAAVPQPEIKAVTPPVAKTETITAPAVITPIITPQQPAVTATIAKEAAAPKPKPVASVSKTATGDFRLQFAALPDQAEAKKAAQTLGKKLTAAMAGRELIVRRAEIPNKGTFYRIQADGFADRAQASATCDKIKALQQSCIVVAP